MKQALLGNLSPFSRFVFAIALTFTCFILVFFAAILLAMPMFRISLSGILGILSQPDKPEALALLKYFQVTQSIGLFIIPPVLGGYLFERNAWLYLKADRSAAAVNYILVFLLMFISLPFINWLVDINEMMKLPAALAGLEDWMKTAEEQAGKLTDSFLAGKSFSKRGVAADVRRQHLQRDDTVELFLAGFIDRAHTALADELDDLQLRECGGQPFERRRFRPLGTGLAGIRGDRRGRHQTFRANPLRRVRRDGYAATGTRSLFCRTIHTCL